MGAMTLPSDVWTDARERMKTGIVAALRDAPGRDADADPAVIDAILDRVIHPEFERLALPPPEERWCVMRRDDNANDFVVQFGLTFADATALALEFERRGHKQVYWVRRE